MSSLLVVAFRNCSWSVERFGGYEHENIVQQLRHDTRHHAPTRLSSGFSNWSWPESDEMALSMRVWRRRRQARRLASFSELASLLRWGSYQSASPFFTEEAREPVTAVSIVGENETCLCKNAERRGLPFCFNGEQVLGDTTLSDVGRTEHKVADRFLFGHKKMEPEFKKELLLRRGNPFLSGLNRHLCRFPSGRLSGRNRSGAQSDPLGPEGAVCSSESGASQAGCPSGSCVYDDSETSKSGLETSGDSLSARPGGNSIPSR